MGTPQGVRSLPSASTGPRSLAAIPLDVKRFVGPRGSASRESALLFLAAAIGRGFGLAFFFGVTAVTRFFEPGQYASVFVLAGVGQVLLTLDMGVGASAIGEVAQGRAVADVLRSLAKIRIRLQKRFTLLFALFGPLEVWILHRKTGADFSTGQTLLLVTVQILFVLSGVRLGPYERIVYGLRSSRVLLWSSVIGYVVSAGFLGVGIAAGKYATTCCMAATLASVVVPRLVCCLFVVSRHSPRSASNAQGNASSLFESDIVLTAKRFSMMQICALVAFGVDQFVVLALRPSVEAGNYIAHSRYFVLGGGMILALSGSIWSPVAAAIARGAGQEARSLCRLTIGIVAVVSLLWCVPPLFSVVTPSMFQKNVKTDWELTCALALWFVIYQVGVVYAQVQASLRDIDFHIHKIVPMTIVNVILSILLCTFAGSVGVVLGSILSFGPMFLLPSMLRLHRLPIEQISDMRG